jgi:urease accessory protein
MRSKLLAPFCALAAAAAPAAAFGHTGHDAATGLLSGFIHPFAGLDHVAAMVAVGLWAARLGAGGMVVLPAAFVLTMASGAVLAFQGVGLPAVELALALSVIALGVLVALEVRVPAAAAAGLVAGFALFHGNAHGGEMAPGASALPYAAGFLVATVALHVAGMAMARAFPRHALRLGGGAVAALGVLIASA